MKVVFRVDASMRIGIGHVMRCRTLGHALRLRGAQVQFVCRDHPGNLIGKLEDDGFEVARLPCPTEDAAHEEDYAVWLGVSQQQDALETLEALDDEGVDWLVVDHYGLDASWERLLRPRVDNLVVIDDLANRKHVCDLLLDQNYAQRTQHRYQGYVTDHCRALLGPRYALLRPEFRILREKVASLSGPIKRMFVFMGGSDPANATGMVLEALSDKRFRHIALDVVVGPNHPDPVALERLARARTGSRLYGLQQRLAELLIKADCSIGAGGTTTWERFCLGVPTLALSVAENQRRACLELHAEGYLHYAGHATEVTLAEFRDQASLFLSDHARLRRLRERGMKLVDGEGTTRVAEIMAPTPLEELTLRPTTEADVCRYFDWANDPLVRDQAFNSQPIAWESHSAWFEQRRNSETTRLLMLEARALPVGQIRFDCDGDSAYIDYSLDELVRGRGWATRLVLLGIQAFRKERAMAIRALVKVGNGRSRRVFSKLGFTLVSCADGVCMYQLHPSSPIADSHGKGP